MAELMEYNKSPTPPEKPGGVAGERNPDRSICADDRGRLTYASMSSSGHVEVELPSLPGSPRPTEQLQARNFGPHVAQKIEAAMNRAPYLRSGPHQDPAAVLAHYLGVSKDSNLLDAGTLDYMERLSKEFAGQKDGDRQTYFQTMVRPFLNGLKPERRKP